MTAAEPRLEHQTLKVKQLVDDYRAGRIVIPEFQREYVWRESKAPRLIDSLYRRFPISSFLLWVSSDNVRPRRNSPRPVWGSTINWLIDGQQRLITLSRAMNGDEGIDIVFNPINEEFRLSNVATKKNGNWFRVCQLLDDNQYRELRRNIVCRGDADKLEKRFERVREILDYEIPIVRMVDHSFDSAVKAFTRINTLGVRLKKEDIESAQIAARHTGFIADSVVPFLTRLRDQGFTRLTIMHLFRACAFVATPDGRNRTPLHELNPQDVMSAWTTTEKATETAIDIIRGELQLIDMKILWSGALLVPLIAICARLKPNERKNKELIGWLALAALCRRYSSSSESALDQDLRAGKTADPIGALLKNLRYIRRLRAEPRDFAGAILDRSGLLTLYIACLHCGIRDFYIGGKVVLQKNVDKHHILPRAQFPEKMRHEADNMANIAFIAGDVNKSINMSGPEVYLSKVSPEVLKSQCIPNDANLWKISEAEAFWKKRRELLAEAFNAFVRERLPNRRL